MVRLASVLSAEQLAFFHENGYLHVPQLFTKAEIDTVRDTFMKMAENGPVEGLSETSRNFAPSDPLAFYPRMMHPHRHPDKIVGPVAMKYMLDARVGAVLAELFGEEAIAAQSMFYFKPPGARGQDLHQDNFYLRVRPGTCMAAWTAIDDADPENGGMVVVPGTHRMDVQCPRESDRTKFFTGDRVDPPAGSSEVPANMKAGDVLFFGGSLIHGSYSNTSKDRFRRAFICHYAPKGCQEVSKWYDPLYLFDGTLIKRNDATGGGPCGQAQSSIKGPH